MLSQAGTTLLAGFAGTAGHYAWIGVLSFLLCLVSSDSTQGPIHFHSWLGSGWGILFSHPKDFTPVCTTELGAVARLAPEWAKRNTKVLGLSVD
uniref:Alkyl hydroperoxide reductase subunit C/ Thiol specific antioxidant domain-containing protein n=1 Tax=Megaselia scalaris TaxID=36166 RepID=T1GV88_MEGSC